MNTMRETILKTREYLDYIEEHYDNVQLAWQIVQDKCKDEFFIYDDFYFNILNGQIERHDLSKLSHYEFVQYRRNFFPTELEKSPDSNKHLTGVLFNKAWESHKTMNSHHWQNWTNKTHVTFLKEREIDCVHMIIDWIAMGIKFNDTALEYYLSVKDEINLSEEKDKFVMRILNLVYNYGDDNNE